VHRLGAGPEARLLQFDKVPDVRSGLNMDTRPQARVRANLSVVIEAGGRNRRECR
jgi:hypothetical protein